MAVTEEKTQQEPSMEEILSSIRRIISADGEGDREEQATAEPEPDPQAEQSEEAPMDRQEEIDTLFDEAPEPAAEADEPAGDVLDLTETVEDEAEAVPAEPEPEIEDDGDELMPAAGGEPPELVSPTTEVASVTSLSTLADAVTGGAGDFGGITIEQLASELMRPMLREWLDRNLPDMVESLVRAEIRRLAEQAKR
jgi:cell pole-organizing protein PopZ